MKKQIGEKKEQITKWQKEIEKTWEELEDFMARESDLLVIKIFI